MGLSTTKSKENWEKGNEDQRTLVGISKKPRIEVMGTDKGAADQYRLLRTHFCKHWCCAPRLVSTAGHGGNPDTVHSLDLWCCGYTCSDHEPVNKIQHILD